LGKRKLILLRWQTIVVLRKETNARIKGKIKRNILTNMVGSSGQKKKKYRL